MFSIIFVKPYFCHKLLYVEYSFGEDHTQHSVASNSGDEIKSREPGDQPEGSDGVPAKWSFLKKICDTHSASISSKSLSRRFD